MERNLEAEIDALRAQVAELAAYVGLAKGAKEETDAEEEHPHVGHVEKMPGMHPDPAIMSVLSRLEDACGTSHDTGRLAYMGVFSSGGRQSTWIQYDVSADKLLGLIRNGSAERVLACIGSNDRLNILLAVLKAPRTVAQLVEECGYSSTGQVYHHLRSLIAADMLEEESRGYYVVRPDRVQGILMLLAGIKDMLDPEQ